MTSERKDSTRGSQILRWVARRTEQGPAWVIYGVPYDCDKPFDDAARWDYDDYRPLVEQGLIDHYDDWKHDYVKLTDAGWAALAGGGAER